jgi:hypothetical protein
MFIHCNQYNVNSICVCWLYPWNSIPALQFIFHTPGDLRVLGREKEGFSMLLQDGTLEHSVMG